MENIYVKGESVEIERITKHDKKTHIELKKITLN